MERTLVKRKPKRPYKCLTWIQRLKLEAYLKAKLPKKEIAQLLGVHISTVYREIKRGMCEHKEMSRDIFGDKIYRIKMKYAPEFAEDKYKQNLQARGTYLKIGNDHELANYIEKRIADDGLTPLSVLGEIKNKGLQFKTSICVRTLYNYIEKDVFLRLDMKCLPIKGKRRKTHKRTLRAARVPRGESIEKRPTVINDRTEFGHWEMDCVIGKTLATLLTFTERLTRKEIVVKIPNKKNESVVKALDTLERKYGRRFSKIFKSITVDNGVEFSDCIGMEKSVYGKNRKRTKFYYCHPYCSSERGTNERLNREVRRKFPKGTNFSHITQKEVTAAEDWINNYPRQILGFSTSEELFQQQLERL